MKNCVLSSFCLLLLFSNYYAQPIAIPSEIGSTNNGPRNHEKIVGGAILGGLAGGAIGAIGAGSGSRFSGAVKGAAIGAVAGGGLSYLRNRFSQSKTTPSPYYNDNTTRKRSFFG